LGEVFLNLPHPGGGNIFLGGEWGPHRGNFGAPLGEHRVSLEGENPLPRKKKPLVIETTPGG